MKSIANESTVQRCQQSTRLHHAITGLSKIQKKALRYEGDDDVDADDVDAMLCFLKMRDVGHL